MQKKHKSYKSSYRSQLIQLAKFYGIIEIKNYLKSAKKLTNSQIELILVKNKIKLPAKKTLSNLNSLIFFKDKYFKNFFYSVAVLVVVVGFFGGAPHLIELFHKVDYDSWKNKSKIVKNKKDSIDLILEKKKEIKPQLHDVVEENFELSENLPKEDNDLFNNEVSLDASVVASLFDDSGYNLSKVRKGKKVKPFYISLLPKDLSKIEDYKERKELFIRIILPLIIKENEKIKKDRKRLFKILAKKSNTKSEKNWLEWKFKEYKIKNHDISELKIRMDIVPVSLAIAQAAIESGWGTSRFALEGNALFGQWTWSGKGLRPLESTEDSNHKVMRFRILRASINAYKKNLNTHSGYEKFREARANLRNNNEKLTGLKLTKYLDKYAANGEEYVKKIEQTINKNSLTDFENAELLPTGLRKEIRL
mgnify:CR=1 FL=1|tara:strand:+ start:21 stop:1283 length:1263 start_codon:yes stop_codon:yes gene_type:complete